MNISKRSKYAVAGILLVAMVGVGAVGAQLFIAIQNQTNFSLASSKISWSPTWWDWTAEAGLEETALSDFSYLSGVISGTGNSQVTFNIKYFPNMDISYKQVVAIRINPLYISQALDLIWDADDIAVGAGDLEYIRIKAKTAELNMDLFAGTTVLSWDAAGVVTIGDFNYPAGGAGFPRDIVLVLEFKWLTSNHVGFSFTVSCVAG